MTCDTKTLSSDDEQSCKDPELINSLHLYNIQATMINIHVWNRGILYDEFAYISYDYNPLEYFEYSLIKIDTGYGNQEMKMEMKNGNIQGLSIRIWTCTLNVNRIFSCIIISSIKGRIWIACCWFLAQQHILQCKAKGQQTF